MEPADLNLLNILYEQVPTGVAIFNHELILQRSNQHWMKFVEVYHISSTRPLKPGHSFYDLIPGSEEMMQPLFARVLEGKTVKQESLRLTSKGITFYWDITLTPYTENDKIVGFVMVMSDATDRELANHLLREREAQYLSIFESTTDSLLIYDLHGTIVEANPAACRLYGYSLNELIGMNSNQLMHPDRYQAVPESANRFSDNEEFTMRGVDVRKDGSIIHVEVHGVPFSYRGKPHALVVIHDITEQVHAYQTLEERVEIRTRELATLLEISNRVSSTLELEPLLNSILDELRIIIEYDGSAIFLLQSPEVLRPITYRGPLQLEDFADRWYLPDYVANREVIEGREPVVIADTLADTPLAKHFREKAGKFIEHMRCWMGIPLIARNQVIGMLTFDSDEPDCYTPRHARLAQAFANQVAVAIDNARLYEQLRQYAAAVEERTHELAALLDMTHTFASQLELRPLLGLIFDQMQSVVDYNYAAIMTLHGGMLEVIEIRGSSPELMTNRPPNEPFPQGQITVLEQVIKERKPVIIGNVHSGDPLAKDLLERRSWDPIFQEISCWMGIPLLVREKVIGILTLNHREQNYFTERHARLALAFANQVAIAIENAQLYEQARELAAMHERQRLARDLHDAVTQTLFSASLIAEVLPELWTEDIEEGNRQLSDLQRLTRGALAEMRSLLLELRPAGLIETPLPDLLRHLCEATTGRTRVKVSLTTEGMRRLPDDVQIVFYRIAQEALNNAIKHAKASEVKINLRYMPDQVELSIIDNGRGFDWKTVPPDHFGLRIMRERAEGISAEFKLKSRIGQGTEIRVCWDN